MVIRRLRHRFDAVSRVMYSIETGTFTHFLIGLGATDALQARRLVTNGHAIPALEHDLIG